MCFILSYNFFKKWSNLCETKTVVTSLSMILLVAASFYIYQAHTEKEVAHQSGIKSQGPCKNESKKYRLNGGECYYLVDEGIVRCNCTRFHAGKRCKMYLCWDLVRI